MRTLVVFLSLAGCPRAAPEPVPSAAAGAPTGPVGPWRCIAFVALATAAEPITVEGTGPTEPDADTAAWDRGCAQLPPTDPPGGCKTEAPPDGWSWGRTVAPVGQGEAAAFRVVLELTPQPLPYQGIAESTANQDEACAAAYTRACDAAGAEPGCEKDPAFVDGGVSAVEDSE